LAFKDQIVLVVAKDQIDL